MVGLIRREFDSRRVPPGEYDSATGCSIEQFIAAKDPFRVTGNGIPVPWPYDHRIGHGGASEIIESLRGQWEDILNNYGIGQGRVGAQHSVSSLGPRGADFPSEMTNHLRIFTSDENTERWTAAATDIYKLLKDAQGHSGVEIRVEITNPERAYSDSSSIIKPESEIHGALVHIEPLLAVQVEHIFGDRWKSISYHMRATRYGKGNSTWDPKPTVFITVLPGTRAHWEIMETQLQEALELFRTPNIQLQLEILPSLRSPSVWKSTKLHPHVMRDLPKMANGSSIAPRKNNCSAGSLGIWVEFCSQDITEGWKKCFLTCYNVIASGDPEHRNRNDIYGIGIDGRTVERSIEIVYPAPIDAALTKEWLMSEKARGVNHNVIENKALETIDMYNSTGGIGYVEFASGCVENSNNTSMDWALVTLKSSNLVTDNKAPHEKFMTRQELYNGNLDYTAGDNTVVWKNAPLVQGSWVAKNGRSTNVTCGEVNALPARIRWENGMVTREVEVLSFKRWQFGEDGDEGAMVTNSEKEWVGMVIGNDASTESTYVTSSQEIMDHIQTKTSGTVCLLKRTTGIVSATD